MDSRIMFDERLLVESYETLPPDFDDDDDDEPIKKKSSPEATIRRVLIVLVVLLVIMIVAFAVSSQNSLAFSKIVPFVNKYAELI